jgi:hypothetical protein
MKTIDRLRARLRRQLRAPIANAIRLRERRNSLGFEHNLAVCAIFRDEAPFLDEWIRFHIGVGATHFYLYNNFSSDDFVRSRTIVCRESATARCRVPPSKQSRDVM